MDSSSKFTSGFLMLMLLLTIVVSVVTMSVCLSIKGTVNKARTDSLEAIAALSSATEEKPKEETPVVYTVFESGGRIVVKTSDGEVVREVDCFVAFLPESDRNALRAGIEISGEKALAALIEDYEN